MSSPSWLLLLLLLLLWLARLGSGYATARGGQRVVLWGWWVGVVVAGRLGWGRSVVGCALRLVGWGWSGVVRARGFGVGGLGGYVAPA